MNEIFKNHPTIETLKVNTDGTQIYYDGKIKTIRTVKDPRNGRRYPVINIKQKQHFVSTLVFNCWFGLLPSSRNIRYKDGNHLNLNYKNLLPQKHDPEFLKGHLRPIKGIEDAFINGNGTYIIQYGYVIDTWVSSKQNRRACALRVGTKTRRLYVSHLVYSAFVGTVGGGRIIHIDRDYTNDSANNLLRLTPKKYKEFAKKNLLKYRSTHPRLCSKIPKQDIEKVKNRLLKGDTLRQIADDYNTTDMSISRFKKAHFSQAQIDHMNKSKGINTTHTPQMVIDEVIEELKAGTPQIEIAKNYNVSPTVICRLNRKHIKKFKGKGTAPKRKHRTPQHIIDEILKQLKEGKRQCEIVAAFKVSSSFVSNLNRKYIKNLEVGEKTPEPIKRGLGSYISPKLKTKVLKLKAANLNNEDIAEVLEIGNRTVNKIIAEEVLK